MSAANKILTVSYGTFSCTIEGFEDPFGTMKQIAEYFRDLAAEDRYFGAEPPVPDAEALRHIAERETARRVEARMASGAVHLRRLDDAAAADAATPVVPVAQPAPMPAPAAVLTPSEVIDPAPASVAERLSRIRAVVARARTQPLWPEDDAAVAPVAAEAAAEDAPASDIRPPAMPVQSATAQVHAAQDDIAPAQTAPGDEVQADEPVVPVDYLNAAWAEADLAAAALQDDRAADGMAPAEATTNAGGSQDETAADDAEGLDDWPAAPRVADAPTAVSFETVADVELAGSSADDLDPVQVQPASGEEHCAEEAEAEVPVESEVEATAPVAGNRVSGDTLESWQAATVPGQDYVRPDLPVARVAVLRKEEHAAATATGQLEDLLAGRIAVTDLYYDDDTAATRAADQADDHLLAAIRAVGVAAQDSGPGIADAGTDVSHAAMLDADDTDALDHDGLHDDVAYARDDRGASDHAADASGGWDADETAGNQPDGMTWAAFEADQPIDRPQGDLDTASDLPEAASDDAADDFDLALDRDDGAPLLLRAADDVEAEDRSDLGPEDVTDARTGHEQAVEDLERQPEDASVDRLLAATNSQLESTEVNRRRSAIAHLKAAVAAARADRRTEEPAEPEEDTGGSAIDKFREDLARVVRPRRPVDQDQPRPTRRLPPLMLVSEQRIDVGLPPARNEDAVSGPVRPRRVMTRDVGDDGMEGAADVAPGGFADFAESMGARDLPDMIEAAAAYTAFVEGRPSFSRPQLMQMMRAGDSDDAGFSREEQLRSFGLLLRQGRIQKLKRGQFTVADDTRFRPPHRHAGE